MDERLNLSALLIQPRDKSAGGSWRTREEWDLMKRIKSMMVIAALALAALAGWQAGSSEVANMELQEDMHDLASQVTTYNKYSVARSDDDYREAVIRRAENYDIQLKPSQVTVQHRGDGLMYLAADYRVPVTLPGYSFVLHFTPSSAKKVF